MVQDLGDQRQARVSSNMKAFKDGNAWCIANDDFVNVQESDCEFVPCDSMVGRFIAKHQGYSKYAGMGYYVHVTRNVDGTETSEISD